MTKKTSTLHRRQQDRIVRIGKFEAEVTNNKRLRSGYCTDRDEASRGLSATTELLIIFFGEYDRQCWLSDSI